MIEFDSFTLSNGLRVIVHRDKNTPVTAMNIIYKVGSRDENVRRTGFAHLFEHLMFGGTKNIPKYDIPLEKAGGENNAFTNSDFTNYYLTVPKNNLEVGFWLESDRMNNLAFSEKSLDIQRNVVIEEYKQNYLNQPFGDAFLLIKPLAYKKHPYRWNTIGKDISHIERASMQHVKSFYEKYYNPDNAILSVTGDVDTSEIEKLAKKWFGPIKPGRKFERSYPVEPVQTEKRIKSVRRNVPQNAIYMAWPMPVRNDIRYYHCDLISDILSNGNSSRLFRELVKNNNVFSEVNAFITGDIDNGLFIVAARLLDNTSMEEGVTRINNEISKLTTGYVADYDLEKVKNKIESNLVFSKISVLSKAMNLGYYELLGDANKWNIESDIYRSISKSDLLNTSLELFNCDHQNILFYNKVRKNN